MTEYVALHPIYAPGGYALAYNTGDAISAQVVAEWGLAVGTDAEQAEGYAPARPADNSDDRAAWEAYVIGQGAEPASARAASLDDLRGMYEAPAPPPAPAHDLPANASAEGVDGTGVQHPTPVSADNVPTSTEPADARPAESARKDEWVTWAVDHGADRAWAYDTSTTKADLIAWTPQA